VRNRAALQARAAEVFKILQALNPEPKTELYYTNPYTLLVAVVLSAQATDKGVNKATEKLFAVADSPQKMLALGEEKLREMVKTIGLYKAKAKNIILLSEQLLARHNGQVPNDQQALEALAGVGQKTANVVRSAAFGEKTLAVDTHVFRLSHRLGFSKGKTPAAVEADLMKIVPDDYLYHAHHWLILHGRYVCVARRPKCSQCPIAALCPSAGKV
jgi:endonuclease-3